MRDSACRPSHHRVTWELATGVDTKFKWAAIGFLVASVVAACLGRGLTVPAADVAGLLALTVPFLLAAVHFAARGHDNLAFCLVAVVEFTAFTCSYTAVSGLVLMSGRPLADDWLVRCDAYWGMHLPSLLAWIRQRSWVHTVLAFSYHTVVPQTLATIFLLGLSGQRIEAQKFLLRLMIAALITLMLFAAFPALGPISSYGLEPGKAQQEYFELFLHFRGALQPTPRFFILQGLITFPSFHAAWAVVLTAAHWTNRRQRALWGGLNMTVIVSTPMIGSHYVTDVIAGVAIGLIVIAGTKNRSKAFWGHST